MKHPHVTYASSLISGLIDHGRKMTAVVMQMADMKLWAQRLWRLWMRRQSLGLPHMFSIQWRWL